MVPTKHHGFLWRGHKSHYLESHGSSPGSTDTNQGEREEIECCCRGRSEDLSSDRISIASPDHKTKSPGPNDTEVPILNSNMAESASKLAQRQPSTMNDGSDESATKPKSGVNFHRLVESVLGNNDNGKY